MEKNLNNKDQQQNQPNIEIYDNSYQKGNQQEFTDSSNPQVIIQTVTNPYDFKQWWTSIQAIPNNELHYPERAALFQRALSYIPGSYKLWYNFLKDTREFVQQFNIKSFNKTDQKYPSYHQTVLDLHESSLKFMYNMPRIWIDYAQFSADCQVVTLTQDIYNRALQTLPVTQHRKIWESYASWALNLGRDFDDEEELIKQSLNKQTFLYDLDKQNLLIQCNITHITIPILKRYVKFEPKAYEDLLQYLYETDAIDQLMLALEEISGLNSKNCNFISKNGISLETYEFELCELIAKYPDKCMLLKNSPIDIIRKMIEKYKHKESGKEGQLWVYLAEFFARIGDFQTCRDIFEESINCRVNGVHKVRDLTILFNSYIQFEHNMLKLCDDDSQNRFEKIEELIFKRPFLFSEVILFNNKNDVNEWMKLINLCEQNQQYIPNILEDTFSRAIQEIDPQNAVGKFSNIWIKFSKFYEQNQQSEQQLNLDIDQENNLELSNIIFDKASQVNYKYSDELSNIFLSWAEMHLRHSNIESAIQILKYACINENSKLQNNIRCWQLYIDLLSSKYDEIFKNLKDNQESEELEQAELLVRDANTRCIEIKIITPAMLFNYIDFLQTKCHLFEQSFRTFEKAIDLFPWPHAYQIWISYFQKIQDRFSENKVDRIRELYQKCLNSLPLRTNQNEIEQEAFQKRGKIPEKGKIFYILYAEFEEKHGFISNAMKIYERALKDLNDSTIKLQIFNLYLAKTTKYYGIIKSRQIFEKAFTLLEGPDLLQVGLRFAKIERKLGEIERCRNIYAHLCQFCNPYSENQWNKLFWSLWEKFELKFGDEDSFADYTLAKQKIELRYSSVIGTIDFTKKEQNDQSKQINEIASQD